MLNLTRDGLETNVRVGANIFWVSLSHFLTVKRSTKYKRNEWTWDVGRSTNGGGDGQHTAGCEQGTDLKRWQRNTGNAAISVTPHAIFD